MEVNTGKLALMDAVAGMAGTWEPVPPDYEKMARLKLEYAKRMGLEPQVNMRGSHPLAKWGRDKRKEKRKAKIAAASRRRNRK